MNSFLCLLVDKLRSKSHQDDNRILFVVFCLAVEIFFSITFFVSVFFILIVIRIEKQACKVYDKFQWNGIFMNAHTCFT